tara:strand:- start:912 stop:1172 length:261 start_codon:yes stop_codon:yes gene_type:complete
LKGKEKTMSNKVVKSESGEYFKVENETLYHQYDEPEWGVVELFEGFTKGDIKELENHFGKFNYTESHVQDSTDITETLVEVNWETE